MDELVICFPAESRWGIVYGVRKCWKIPIYVIPEFSLEPPDCPLHELRTWATIDHLAKGLSGDRGADIRRVVDAHMAEANRQLNGEATLSRRPRG